MIYNWIIYKSAYPKIILIKDHKKEQVKKLLAASKNTIGMGW